MRKRIYSPAKLTKLFTILIIQLFTNSTLFAQNYEWEIDKHNKREQDRKQELDSLMVYLKNNWQLSLSYGQWNFGSSAKSNKRTSLEIPKNMGVWNLSLARFITNSISLNLNLGMMLKKIEPPRPNIFSVLGGADVDVEGGGLFLAPLSFGMDYFFLKQRFRPFLGFNIGRVSAKYKFIEASGNISNGINRNEFNFKSKAPFGELSSGFIYRTGKNVQLGLNCDFLKSKDFNEALGGYKAYNGLKISALFSVVF